MPSFRVPVLADGPLVDVRIGFSRLEVRRLRLAGGPIPQPVSLRALLDTGAEVTCADPQSLANLFLPVQGIAFANAPALGGVTPVVQRDASLTIVHPANDSRLDLSVGDLPLAELPLAALGYQVLLGRDVLTRCRLFYNGPAQYCRLRY